MHEFFKQRLSLHDGSLNRLTGLFSPSDSTSPASSPEHDAAVIPSLASLFESQHQQRSCQPVATKTSGVLSLLTAENSSPSHHTVSIAQFNDVPAWTDVFSQQAQR
jgi:hypothetical protein